MNAIIGALCLAILAAINTRVAGSLRYPPALFAAWWSLLLIALACSGETFFPLSPATLVIYIVGPCAMSAGGLLALTCWRRPRSGRVVSSGWVCRQRLLTASIVLLIVLFPGLWYRIRELSAASGVRDFWVGVRLQTMQVGDTSVSLGVFDYLIFFSTIAAWVAFQDWQRRRIGHIRAVAAIAIGLLYHLVTASRLGALVLIGGLVGIALLQGKSLVRPLLAGALAVVPVFTTVALALNKAGQRGGDFSHNAVSLARSFQLYALGGLVAFESAVDGSVAPAPQGRTYRVAYVVARKFGYPVDVPEVVSQYAYTPTPTNIYTLYYPYFSDFGHVGVAVLLCFLGWMYSCIYLGARRGLSPFITAYGMVFSYIVLSSADEYVFSLFSMSCQAMLYLLLLYKPLHSKLMV